MSNGPEEPAGNHHAQRPDASGADADATGGSGRDRRLLRWLVLLVVLVLLGLYVAGYALADERLPRGTTIAGVSVGGQKPQQASSTLRQELDSRLDDPVTLVVADQEYELDPEEVGLEVDIPGSVAQAPSGRSWNPADMWETFVGGEDYNAVVLTVDDLLTKRLKQISKKSGEAPVEGDVTFTKDGPEPVYPEPGERLDLTEARDAVMAAYPSDGSPVEVELVEEEAEVSESAVSRAMKEFANPAMSAPVTYVIADEKVTLRPEQFAPALAMKPEDGELVPQVRTKKLMQALRPVMKRVGERAQNATIEIRNGEPRVVPAKKGVDLDRKELGEAFLTMVAKEDGRRSKIPTKPAQPDVTTKEIRQLNIKEKVSEFTTSYPHADYRNVNIGRGAEIVDGTILRPGETFSLNDTVGERTAENGFTEGFIISDGILKEDLGGGVSQLATTLFNAAFFAGLEDVEHKPHSFYIDRYPVGREATVAWPVVDLRFKNDTDHGIYIEAVLNPSAPGGTGSITVRMYSTKVWDIESITGERYNYTEPDTRRISGEDCEPNSGSQGFTIDVTRVFRRPGDDEVVRRENFNTVYTPADEVICE